MALLDKIATSKLSLQGNGFDEPKQLDASWGYANPDPKLSTAGLNPLNPKFSPLQYTYDVDSNPKDIKIIDYNKTKYKPYLPTESHLDELDDAAPKNARAGKAGSVVSQIYKSAKGSKYEELGPKDGFYHKDY